MSNSKQDDTVVSIAKPHTIKKFDLIATYISGWAPKLLNIPNCDGVVFIDCMCNSGVYVDIYDREVCGTPVRASMILSESMKLYPGKRADLYFNDLSEAKIARLNEELTKRGICNTANFRVHTLVGDGNEFLKVFRTPRRTHCLLIYDPYEAAIDWEALKPFLNSWSEVIINHMIHDAIRGISQAKKPAVKAKYEETYQLNFEDLVGFEGDRDAFEHIINKIIAAQRLSTTKEYFVSSFPFFNRANNIVYKLIHHTSNITGFNLFKKTAWQTFGGRSSGKNTHGDENQLMFDLSGGSEPTTGTDELCYNIYDIAKFLREVFRGKADVPFDDVYSVIETHPVFPSEGFREDIKRELKSCGVKVSRQTMTFPT